MSGLPVATSGASAMDVAWQCMRTAGEIALSHFQGEHEIGRKGRGNVVTEADVAVELRVHEILGREFQQHKILSEETAADTDPSSGWTWVLDPIDGTMNYSRGIPVWCTTIALCRDADPVLGITYDPVRDEAFWAAAGSGARVRSHVSSDAPTDTPIAVSEAADVNSAVIGVDLGYDDELGGSQIALMSRIFPRVQSIRILGSAALAFAYVACGRLDLFTHMNISPWDIAAGILLVREAGGVASDRSGGPLRLLSRSFAAGGRRVHDDFMARYGGVQGG
jgi:fructose-1,6-bisphosphatase/inositol monophosphatase family enzyme